MLVSGGASCRYTFSSAGASAAGRLDPRRAAGHLRVIEEVGLLRSRRRGRESVWQVLPRRQGDARRYLELISQQWDNALGRLRKLVED